MIMTSTKKLPKQFANYHCQLAYNTSKVTKMMTKTKKTKKNKKLPYKAIHNIECNTKACLALSQLPINTNPNQTLPASFPHLQIQEHTIVRNYMNYLWNAAQLPTHYQYLVKKFNWTHDTPCMINWQIVELTMRWFQPPDWICIQKIIHEWAPTHESPGSYPTAVQDHQCPTCCQHPKTLLHLLQCNHAKWWAILSTTQCNLQELSIKHQVDLHIHQLWWLGMKSIIHSSPQPEQELYPTRFQRIFKAQKKIGWKQLYYGRIAKEWIKVLQQHDHKQTNAIQYYTQVLTITWTGLLQLWKLRNKDNNAAHIHHPANMDSDLTGIFSTWHWLSQQAQDRIFKLTREELQNKPKEYIKKWIINSTLYIHNELKTAEKQQCINNNDICQFLTPG